MRALLLLSGDEQHRLNRDCSCNLWEMIVSEGDVSTCVCVCVCVCVYVCVSVRECVYVSVRACMYVRVCIYMYVHTYSCEIDTFILKGIKKK